MAIAYSGLPTRDRAIVPTTYPRTTYPIQPPAAPQPMAPTAPAGGTVYGGVAPYKPPPPTGMQPLTPPPGLKPTAPAPGGVTVPPPNPGFTQVPLPPPEQASNFTPPAKPEPVTDFGPGNDLQFSQINPAPSDRLREYQDQLLNYSKGLENTPDRGELARQAYEEIAASSEPDFEKAQRGIGQNAAALGRIGSGITTTELGDLGLQRAKYLGGVQKQLATESAQQTLADRLARLNAGAGIESQTAAEEAGQRGELRGERGYESGVAQNAYDRQVQQKLLEDQLRNSQFGRASTAAQLGLEGAQLYGGQAAEAGGASGDLLNQLALEKYFRDQNPAGAGAPSTAGYDYNPDISFQDPNQLPTRPLFPTRQRYLGPQ